MTDIEHLDRLFAAMDEAKAGRFSSFTIGGPDPKPTDPIAFPVAFWKFAEAAMLAYPALSEELKRLTNLVDACEKLIDTGAEILWEQPHPKLLTLAAAARMTMKRQAEELKRLRAERDSLREKVSKEISTKIKICRAFYQPNGAEPEVGDPNLVRKIKRLLADNQQLVDAMKEYFLLHRGNEPRDFWGAVKHLGNMRRDRVAIDVELAKDEQPAEEV